MLSLVVARCYSSLLLLGVRWFCFVSLLFVLDRAVCVLLLLCAVCVLGVCSL